MLKLLKRLSTKEQMSMQKGENEKMPFAFSMWKQPRWSCFNIMFYSISSLLLVVAS
jgi:hypothetical protein